MGVGLRGPCDGATSGPATSHARGRLRKGEASRGDTTFARNAGIEGRAQVPDRPRGLESAPHFRPTSRGGAELAGELAVELRGGQYHQLGAADKGHLTTTRLELRGEPPFCRPTQCGRTTAGYGGFAVLAGWLQEWWETTELRATPRVRRNYHRIDPDDELAKGGYHRRSDGDLGPCLGAPLKHYQSLNAHDQRSA